MQPALLISTLKSKLNRSTREAINTEVQNTLHLISTVPLIHSISIILQARGIIEKTFVPQNTDNEAEVSRAETDTEEAKRWIAKIYLLFKSFDADANADKSKYIPAIEAQEPPKVDESKMTDIKAEESRYMGQQKSLKMEIEDVSFYSLEGNKLEP
jgi:hypothetical protein